MISRRALAALPGRACGALLALAAAAPLSAQDGVAAACASEPMDPAFCRAVALGAEALIPAVVVAAEGGNPVPGTASTLGMRLTSMPRWSVAGRLTLAWASAPDLVERGGGDVLQVTPAVFAIDGTVGVLEGFSPLPTVGGVASLDLLWGAALVPLLVSDELGGSGGWSWAAGARVGLLRESFTLPGVSVSAMFRQVRDIGFGDDELETTDAYIRSDVNVVSVRAAATKSILLLNVTGGVGWDRISGDVELGYESLAGFARATAPDVVMERVTVFGEVSYTLMVLSFVLGGGWQEGPQLDEGALAGDEYDAPGTGYASAALRLAI
ncbi:MAG TPA: hypothetical protein VF039_07410 [Longimicrobiales bacterium]